MLSKLWFFESEAYQLKNNGHDDFGFPVLQSVLGDRIKSVVPVSGGTLGACYFCEIDGRHRFLKTNTYPQGAKLLRKEFFLLRYFYSAALAVEDVNINTLNNKRTWFYFNRLKNINSQLTPENIDKLIKENRKKTCDFEKCDLIPKEDNISFLLKKSKKSLEFLYDKKLLTEDLENEVRHRLCLLDGEFIKMPQVLCHGDLGPKNILADGSFNYFLIDWEDAFWGVEEYDYLYWLTFFENRRYYADLKLSNRNIEPECAKNIMLMIVVLKSYISYISGSYSNNSVSFGDRLIEILNIK